MQKKDTISVIIPCYNCQPYIEDTVRSVLSQTLPPDEILLIEDGSSDNTLSMLRKLEQQDSRIHLYENEGNRGVAYSRNRGVSLATGGWVAFLDSDDQWTIHKLRRQMAFLNAKQAEFTFTGSAFLDETGQRYRGTLAVPETVDRKTLLHQNVISCSSVIIRRSLMARYPMKSGEIHEDFDAWLRILGEIPMAYGLNEPLLLYRLRGDSKSGNKWKSFQMNYKTYRSVGLNPLSAAVNMCYYTKNGLKKYRNIRK